MEYRYLGRSGLRVSPLCVGTMTWGDATSQEEATAIVKEAREAGINFFDTADTYHGGRSEEILGQALAETGDRDQVVVASKFTGPTGDGPNDRGSDRFYMIRACEASLKRLGTDRIDLYQVHLMDLHTPVDEIMLGLDTLVRQGKVIHVGTSKWASTLITEGVALSQRHGWPRFVTEQPPYNLLDRGVEKELVFTCLRQGIGLIPWAPLATGILSGKYGSADDAPEGSRFAKARAGAGKRLSPEALRRTEELKPVAARLGIPLAQLALAWLRQQPAVTAPILGVRAREHLRSGLESLRVELTETDLDEIDAIAPPGSQVSDYWGSVTFKSPLLPFIRPHRRQP